MGHTAVNVDALIGFADTHCGCQFGLCPAHGIRLDGGGRYVPHGPTGKFQRKLWTYWRYFWDEWVPKVTRGCKYGIVFDGDVIDGRHHGTTTQWSHNLSDQANCAEECIGPEVEGHPFWFIRGTEAHGGPSCENEEDLARRLHAIPNEDGQNARYELWKYIGKREEVLTHWLHHIGTTGSAAYETTAIHKELVDGYQDAGRWNRRPADFEVRAHRHFFGKTEVASHNERGTSLVLPGWQGKTPLGYRIGLARQRQPEFGGIMIRLSDEGEPYERHFVKPLKRPRPE